MKKTEGTSTIVAWLKNWRAKCEPKWTDDQLYKAMEFGMSYRDGVSKDKKYPDLRTRKKAFEALLVLLNGVT